MAIELIVFRLQTGGVEPVDEWLADFKAYLHLKGWDKEIIQVRGPEQMAKAPWLGQPFVIVGEVAEISEHLELLSHEARRILFDCAYFWLVSGEAEKLLEDKFVELTRERVVALDWHRRNYEVIINRLELLQRFPRLAGLSRGMHRVRTEIERISAGKKGPATPTLILGESGTGKEEVAQTLHAASGRRGAFAAVACGWFTEGMLQDQLFGHARGAYPNAVRDKKGLLEANSNGTVLLDDLDAAVTTITGALLRVMATPKGKPAKVYRIGEEDTHERETSVWMIFSTNADIQRLIVEGKLREDFVFRFGDRIIHIPPLRERPADIPAIALLLWDKLWEDKWDKLREANRTRPRPLSPPVLQHLCAQETKWKGNVRALQALLSLTASMANLPAHAAHSLRQIIDEIMLRGPEYSHWVGIIASPAYAFSVSLADQVVRELRELDEAAIVAEAQAALTADAGQPLFNEALSKAKEEKPGSSVAGQRLRLARIVAYVARKGELNNKLWFSLSKKDETDAKAKFSAGTFKNDIDLLVAKESNELPRLLKKKEGKADYHQPDSYEPVGGMFN